MLRSSSAGQSAAAPAAAAADGGGGGGGGVECCPVCAMDLLYGTNRPCCQYPGGDTSHDYRCCLWNSIFSSGYFECVDCAVPGSCGQCAG
ncbi:hypothetical protein PLESTB_000327200 [Pleodorina starrii]|uniref:Uncharacterized protein n=1 Tax=Pleodorina starrii TaxID=330485 RepID=A0A9W6BDV0_9CHLO|nr:hypothetical protein PLESTB_000327200 [Pleodorina starrii]GLC75086.1 hypothetical protein PLESTF_001592400 [Pleodorina starrii]